MADFNVKPLEANLDFDHLRYWDVVIIGAGPAGLAASLTTAHRALTTLVIEAKGTPGGQPHFLYSDKRIVDIPFRHPRDVVALGATPEFGALKLDIWRVLEDEVNRARALEQ